MARPKRFRLHTMARVRKQQEDMKAQGLAAARRQVRVAEGERRALAEEQTLALQRAAVAPGVVFDPGDAHRFFEYARYLARAGLEKEATIMTLKEEEQARRAELEEARKQRLIIERLKERQDDAFQAWADKEIRTGLDEIATNRSVFQGVRRRRP